MYVKDKSRPYFYVRTLPDKFQVHELDQKILWEGKDGSVRLDNITSKLTVIANGTMHSFEWNESKCKILKRDGTLLGYVEHRSQGYSDFYNVFCVSYTKRPYQQSFNPKDRSPWYDYRWNYYIWIDV